MNRRVLAMIALGFGILGLGGCATTSPPGEQGAAFYNSGNYLFAADAFTDEIRHRPRSAAAWNNRAVARVRLGDLPGALRDYNRAIELAPGDPELYLNRANALVASGLYQDAIMDYSRAVQIAPTYARAIFNRGTAYAMAGLPDAARRDWQAAIEMESDPYAKSAMRRSAGLEPAMPAVALAPAGQPTTVATIAPPPAPGTRPGAPPLPVVPPGAPFANVTQPAASPMTLDARALTARAISRELDGDHAGAIQDLNAALSIEPQTVRREAIARLIRLLETPR